MREYTFKPEVEGCEGHMLLKVPSYMERMKLAQEAGINPNGDVEMDKIMALFGKVNLFVLKVDMKVHGEQVNDIEELGMFAAGAECINAAVGVLAGGIPAPKGN